MSTSTDCPEASDKAYQYIIINAKKTHASSMLASSHAGSWNEVEEGQPALPRMMMTMTTMSMMRFFHCTTATGASQRGEPGRDQARPGNTVTGCDSEGAKHTPHTPHRHRQYLERQGLGQARSGFSTVLCSFVVMLTEEAMMYMACCMYGGMTARACAQGQGHPCRRLLEAVHTRAGTRPHQTADYIRCYSMHSPGAATPG